MNFQRQVENLQNKVAKAVHYITENTSGIISNVTFSKEKSSAGINCKPNKEIQSYANSVNITASPLQNGDVEPVVKIECSNLSPDQASEILKIIYNLSNE
jgi:hypothetical protein